MMALCIVQGDYTSKMVVKGTERSITMRRLKRGVPEPEQYLRASAACSDAMVEEAAPITPSISHGIIEGSPSGGGII